MVNLFARVGIKNGSEPGDNVVFAKTSGDIMHPRLLKPLPPTPLDGKSIPLDSPDGSAHRVRRLADQPDRILTSRDRWSTACGPISWAAAWSIPVDDVRATNPASNEELFAALAKDFVDHRYDVKCLIRTIMNSGVYQLSVGSERDEPERQQILFEVHRQAPAGGSDSGRLFAGHRRADAVSRATRRARAPCSCPTRR